MIKTIIAIISILPLLLLPYSNATKPPNDFYAKYNVYYKNKISGFLIREFYYINDSEYIYKSESKINITLGFIPISDNRKEISTFNILDSGVFNPKTYQLNRTGTWIDFIMNVNFNHSNNTVHMLYKGKERSEHFKDELLDNGTYQIKFQQEARNRSRRIYYRAAYKNSFRHYDFKYVKVDYIEINNILEEAVLYEMNTRQKNVKTWMLTSKNYVMGKTVIVDKKNSFKSATFILLKYKNMH